MFTTLNRPTRPVQPYQPEISQGRLEALINFQTLVCDLTGMDIANASLLDEATAAAEAMAPAKRTATTASTIPDLRAVITTVHASGGVVVVAAHPLALILLASPGELGADIAVGSMQRYGVPMGFGGPHAAYMAVKSAFQRGIPGRLVGISKDAHGDPAYRLALQTREQHIRRDKATSNICTSQVLLAIVASMYAIYHGPEGLKVIAQAVHRRTAVLAAGLRRLGYKLVSDSFFDTISVIVGGRTEEIQGRAGRERINMRIVRAGDADVDAVIGISTDETTTERTIEAVWRCFGGTFEYQSIASEAPEGIPTAYRRTSRVLEHPVFNRYRSETEMLRYMRRLSDRDIALCDSARSPLSRPLQECAGTCGSRMRPGSTTLQGWMRGDRRRHR